MEFKYLPLTVPYFIIPHGNASFCQWRRLRDVVVWMNQSSGDFFQFAIQGCDRSRKNLLNQMILCWIGNPFLIGYEMEQMTWVTISLRAGGQGYSTPIYIPNALCFFLYEPTDRWTDGQTDGSTEGQNRVHNLYKD